MKKWRELAWLVGLAALAALLIAFAILLALRLSAGPARAANEPPAPVYSSAALAAHLAVAPDVAAHEPQTPEPVAEPEPEPRYEEITAEERELLARVVYAESNTEPIEGQIAVAQVVLNRVRSSEFPNTIAGVIYQKNAFSCVSDGQINLTPNAESKRAAQDALGGWDPSGGSLYYYNPNTASDSWIFSRTTVTVIGNHCFAV